MTTYESKTTSFFKVVTFLVFSFFFLFSVNARARAAELDHQAPYTNIHVDYDETTVVYTLEAFNFTNRYVFDGIVKIGFKNDNTDYLWVKTSKNEVYCICTNDLPDSMKNANRKIMRKDTYSVGTFIEMNTYLYKFEDMTDFTISNSSTPVPTQKPTTVPTRKPTATPTQKPTIKPTAKPTAEPTATPTTVTVAETQQDAVSTTSMTNVSDAVSSVQTTEQPASQQPVQYVTYAEMLEAIKQAAQNSSVTTVVKATATPKATATKKAAKATATPKVKTTKKTKSTATPKATKKPVATAKPKATKKPEATAKPKTKLKKKSSKSKKKKVSNSDSDEKYSSVSLSEIIQYNEESKTLIISKTKKQVIKNVKEYGYTEKGTNVFIKDSSLYKIKNNKIKLVKKNIIAFCYDEDDNVSKYVIKKAGKPVAIPINF